MREVKMIFVWLWLFEALWQQLASLSKAKFKTGCNTLSLSTLPPKLSPMTRPTSKSQFLPHPHYFSCLFSSWPPWSSSSDIGNFWFDQPQLQKATDVLAGISWLPPPFPVDPPPHLQHWLLLPRFDTFQYIWGYLSAFEFSIQLEESQFGIYFACGTNASTFALFKGEVSLFGHNM